MSSCWSVQNKHKKKEMIPTRLDRPYTFFSIRQWKLILGELITTKAATSRWMVGAIRFFDEIVWKWLTDESTILSDVRASSECLNQCFDSLIIESFLFIHETRELLCEWCPKESAPFCSYFRSYTLVSIEEKLIEQEETSESFFLFAIFCRILLYWKEVRVSSYLSITFAPMSFVNDLRMIREKFTFFRFHISYLCVEEN